MFVEFWTQLAIIRYPARRKPIADGAGCEAKPVGFSLIERKCPSISFAREEKMSIDEGHPAGYAPRQTTRMFMESGRERQPEII